MIGLFRLGLAAFGGAGILTKAIVIGAMVLSLLTAYGVWHHKIWSNGYARAVSDIAAQDEKAINRAKAARSKFLDCRTRGLRWNQSAGECEGR